MNVRKIVSSGLLALILTFGLVLSGAATAKAEETTYCGRILTGADPAEDPFGALREMSDDFYDDLYESLGGPQWACGPYHWLIEYGAQLVVAKHSPEWLSRGIDVYATINDNGEVTVPEIPRVGPSAVSGRVSWTGGEGLWLRGGPGWSSSLITTIPEGTVLQIECQVRGEPISNGFQTTDLWDRVTFEGASGFVADAFVDTRTVEQVAPTC